MELSEIVDRYAEGLAAVDQTTETINANQRTGEVYEPGVKALRERQAVAEVDAWWARTYPGDFEGPLNQHATDHPYPNLARAACDHVLTTDGVGEPPEWAIEVKNITSVGNNGKANDFPAVKMLSPLLKDRSLIHDALRLRQHQVGRRQAVLAYTFRYSPATCAEARRLHPEAAPAIEEIERVCRRNGGDLNPDDLAILCDGILRVRGLIVGLTCRQTFEAWRHPCGGQGVVYGWEVAPPGSLAHPW